jgi:hypothetical protein
VDRQGQESKDVIASLSNSVHADAVTSVATRSEDIGLVLNKTGHVNDMTRRMFLASTFVVGVVEGNSYSRSTWLTIESHISNISPALVLSKRFVERQLHGDRSASSAKHNWLGGDRGLLNVDLFSQQRVGVVERRGFTEVRMEVLTGGYLNCVFHG